MCGTYKESRSVSAKAEVKKEVKVAAQKKTQPLKLSGKKVTVPYTGPGFGS